MFRKSLNKEISNVNHDFRFDSWCTSSGKLFQILTPFLKNAFFCMSNLVLLTKESPLRNDLVS